MKKSKYNRFWVVRESDGKLYCTNLKPYRVYNSECKDDYEWQTDGDFMEIDSYKFNDLKFTDDPVEVDILVIEWKVDETSIKGNG